MGQYTIARLIAAACLAAAPWAIALGCSAALHGCGGPREAAPADGDRPLVRVGSASRPAAELHVSPGAVRAEGTAELSVGRQSRATSQAADVTAAPTDVRAGGDADSRQTTITVNASGSGWALVAAIAAALLAAIVLGLLWLRARQAYQAEADTAGHAINQASVEYERLRAEALAVAEAIRDMGPGPQRDRLLAGIRAGLGAEREHWDQVIGRRRVARRDIERMRAQAAHLAAGGDLPR